MARTGGDHSPARDQLLGMVILAEKASLEEDRNTLLEEINSCKRIMAECEAQLLTKLSESKASPFTGVSVGGCSGPPMLASACIVLSSPGQPSGGHQPGGRALQHAGHGPGGGREAPQCGRDGDEDRSGAAGKGQRCHQWGSIWPSSHKMDSHCWALIPGLPAHCGPGQRPLLCPDHAPLADGGSGQC
jgi:hypothetical protein